MTKAPAVVNSRMIRESKARRHARRRLIGFVQYMWSYLNPGTPAEWGWHHYEVAEHVEAWLAGEFAGKWFIINLPPGESKSTIFSRCALPWWWLDNPESRFYCGCHDLELARKMNIDRRKVIHSAKYDRLRSGWLPSSDGRPGRDHATWRLLKGADNKTYFENTRFGYSAICYPSGNFPLGVHPTHQLYDDIVRQEKGKVDPAKWGEAFQFMDGDMASRTGNRTLLNRMLGMQRLGEPDPTGMILDKYGDQVVHLNVRREFKRSYPCPCRPERPDGRCETPLGSRDPRTEDGELLPGTRMTIEILDTMTAHERATQQNQSGVPLDGKYFRKDLWGVWVAVPPQARMLWTLDAAGGTTGDRSSHSTFYALAEHDGYVDIVDELHEKLDAKQLEKAAVLWCQRWPAARRKLIESKALGPAVVSTLERLHIRGITPINPDKHGDKASRAISWYRFQGQFRLPRRDAARPPGLAEARDPAVLDRQPFVGALAPAMKLLRAAKYRAALSMLIKIDEGALSFAGRRVHDVCVDIAVGGWEPMDEATITSFKDDFAAVPSGSRWDRPDSLFLGAEHYRPRLARAHGRLERPDPRSLVGFEDGPSAPVR